MESERYKIIIHGGIGSQIIRMLVGIGKAIKNEIKPSQLRIVRCLYDEIHSDINLRYHNLEDLRSYTQLNPEIEYEFCTDRTKYKSVKFDQVSLEFIYLALNSHLFSNYVSLTQYMERNMDDKVYKNTAWLRGKDRKTNIAAIDESIRKLGIEDEINFITNDISQMEKYSNFNNKIVGGTSTQDFKIILNSKCILSQISGFTVTPFLLNKYPQKFILLPKDSHLISEYMYLEKDWMFFTQLLKIACKVSQGKELMILN